MESAQLVSEPVAGQDLNFLLDEVYEPGFYAVARFISGRGGTLDDAKDIFQDTCVILHEHLQDGRMIDSPVRYLTGIAKHLWYKEARTRSKAVRLEESADVEVEETKSLQDATLRSFLERAGKRCMDLLEAFYFHKQSIRSVMNTFGFGSEHSASVQKYKCIEKLRNELKSKSLSYEDFFE